MPVELVRSPHRMVAVKSVAMLPVKVVVNVATSPLKGVPSVGKIGVAVTDRVSPSAT